MSSLSTAEGFCKYNATTSRFISSFRVLGFLEWNLTRCAFSSFSYKTVDLVFFLIFPSFSLTRLCAEKLNVATDLNFTEAFRAAASADAQREDVVSEGRDPEDALPPLFGLPVSIKENIQMKGFDTTSARIAYLSQPAREDR